MVLEHDVGDIDGGFSLTATKVEYEHYLRHIDAGHVALPEDIVLVGLEVNAVGEVEHTIVAVEYEFDSGSIQVFIAIEDSREVVIVGSTGGEVGMHLHLSLPLVGSGLWQRDGVVVALVNETRVGNLTPAGSIPELHGRSNTFPHIILAVGIVTFPYLLTLLGGEDEAPGYATVGLIIDQHYLLGRQRLDAEQRVGILIVGTDVRESGVGSQMDVGLLGNVAIGIFPVENFEIP